MTIRNSIRFYTFDFKATWPNVEKKQWTESSWLPTYHMKGPISVFPSTGQNIYPLSYWQLNVSQSGLNPWYLFLVNCMLTPTKGTYNLLGPPGTRTPGSDGSYVNCTQTALEAATDQLHRGVLHYKPCPCPCLPASGALSTASDVFLLPSEQRSASSILPP